MRNADVTPEEAKKALEIIAKALRIEINPQTPEEILSKLSPENREIYEILTTLKEPHLTTVQNALRSMVKMIQISETNKKGQ